jgi:hypothetical protein
MATLWGQGPQGNLSQFYDFVGLTNQGSRFVAIALVLLTGVREPIEAFNDANERSHPGSSDVYYSSLPFFQ